jgi:hypothetical protein
MSGTSFGFRNKRSTIVAISSTADVVRLIVAMTASTDDKVSLHARTLLGPRTRGSTTDKGLDEVPAAPLHEVTDALLTTVRMPGCRYFQGIVPNIGGCRGAVAYKEVDPTTVKRREGTHGPELYIDCPAADAQMDPTNVVTVVLGPVTEYPEFPNGIVYTWFPGDPLIPLRPGSEPTHDTAVNIHNGT